MRYGSSRRRLSPVTFHKMPHSSPARAKVHFKFGTCSLELRLLTILDSSWAERAPLREPHRHTASRTQRDHRPGLHHLGRINELQPEPLSDNRQQQYRFQLGKAGADTHPLTTTKWHVREARKTISESVR